jgi:predicted transposase YdaD
MTSSLAKTKDANPDTLNKLLKETKIDGGDIMPTLAQRWKDEGKKEWIAVGMQKGEKTGMKTGMKAGVKAGMKAGVKAGMKAERLKTAKKMLSDNVSIEAIAQYTDLTEKEVRSLIH